MKDLRDPNELGLRLLAVRAGQSQPTLSATADVHRDYLRNTRNHTANPSPLEKYGRPQDLPETPF